ncbi:uncharacterized protein LOC122504769 [Leptopilina heterotoma]|uniref:uncharacterized protein LOC122504769 n=1 Tax=Leptopilina heterotoma TaxID=63436 RepID=UPI001CA8E565|nr:uncharacterized protein LOC122504769 [Leptopilina heterotoma]
MKIISVLVLLFAIVFSQGHPLLKSEATEDKLPEPEKIPTAEKEKPDLNAKPEPIEESSAPLKPESPNLDLKPQTENEAPPVPVIPDNVTPELPSNINLERKYNEYDQRQNGSENYRIQVDGLVFVLAPADALLLAGGAAEGSDLLGAQPNITALLNATGLKSNKEHSEPSQLSPLYYSAPKKQSEGPVSIKLINLIAPLLEQRRNLGR